MKKTLSVVTREQAEKLKRLGFDWATDSYYEKDSGRVIFVPYNEDDLNSDVESISKDYTNCISAPTIAIALKWLRDKYGIYQSIYVRSINKNIFGYSVGHSILLMDLIGCDLSEEFEIENAGTDGIHGLSYEEAESNGMNFAINWILKNAQSIHGI